MPSKPEHFHMIPIESRSSEAEDAAANEYSDRGLRDSGAFCVPPILDDLSTYFSSVPTFSAESLAS